MGWFDDLLGGNKPTEKDKPKNEVRAKTNRRPSSPSKSKEASVKTSGTTSAYQPGKPQNRTTIVLSAPGKEEQRAGKPAAGQTGRNLNKILEQAHANDPKRFPSAKKDDYQIVNSVEKVHYLKETRDTEGSSREVADSANLDRVRQHLLKTETVVALGKRANDVVQKSGYSGEILTGSHPSFQNLNRNYESEKATPVERTEDRLQQFAKCLLSQRQKKGTQ